MILLCGEGIEEQQEQTLQDTFTVTPYLPAIYNASIDLDNASLRLPKT
jgi:hypothetical protein